MIQNWKVLEKYKKAFPHNIEVSKTNTTTVIIFRVMNAWSVVSLLKCHLIKCLSYLKKYLTIQKYFFGVVMHQILF